MNSIEIKDSEVLPLYCLLKKNENGLNNELFDLLKQTENIVYKTHSLTEMSTIMKELSNE